MNLEDDARRSTRFELLDAMSRCGMTLPCRPVPSMLIEAMELSAERRLEASDAPGPNPGEGHGKDSLDLTAGS